MESGDEDVWLQIWPDIGTKTTFSGIGFQSSPSLDSLLLYPGFFPSLDLEASSLVATTAERGKLVLNDVTQVHP